MRALGVGGLARRIAINPLEFAEVGRGWGEGGVSFCGVCEGV